MATQADIALAHQRARVELSNIVMARTGQLWSQASVNTLDGSWDALAPSMIQVVTAAQVTAASLANPYMDAMDASYGNVATGSVIPEAYAGVMATGRPVGGAMFTAVTTAKTAIGRGMAPFEAFRAGATALSVVVSNAVQDAGKGADLSLMGARSYTEYVRVAGGACCARCAVLLGMRSGADAFLRHVCCQCTAAPVSFSSGRWQGSSGFFQGPRDYFDSLSGDDQDRIFTKAGAEAIRGGADPSKVVNARSGSYYNSYVERQQAGVVAQRNSLRPVTVGVKSDGKPVTVYATATGNSATRKAYRTLVNTGSTSSDVRLMPESIIKIANGDTTRLRELLNRYGYMR